jgi:hypothetical protein
MLLKSKRFWILVVAVASLCTPALAWAQYAGNCYEQWINNRLVTVCDGGYGGGYGGYPPSGSYFPSVGGCSYSNTRVSVDD